MELPTLNYRELIVAVMLEIRIICDLFESDKKYDRLLHELKKYDIEEERMPYQKDLLYGVADVNGDSIVSEEDIKGRELTEYVADADELSRVYEINYLSNIAPQDHNGFNGGTGVWRNLERYIQETIVKGQQKEVWVITGTVLGKSELEKVGPNNDITVPPMFFKIVVREDEEGSPLVLAFLMPHHKEAHGNIEDYLVSVDIIEAMTGFDLFRELEDEQEAELERIDTWVNWKEF